jgi:hypothetical protein
LGGTFNGKKSPHDLNFNLDVLPLILAEGYCAQFRLILQYLFPFCFIYAIKIGLGARTSKAKAKMTTFESSQITAISRIFSSSVIREMATKGKSPLFVRLANEAKIFENADDSLNVGELLESAFSILKEKSHRHEYVYKAALTKKILLGRHSLGTASMLTEFRIGDCKADLVILNGTGTVYEIKSERDSLSRLERQIAAYRDVFATVYVIAGANHLDSIFKIVPQDVGVLLLSNRYQITEKRLALVRPDRTNSAAIFDSIRLSEAKQILIQTGVKVPHVPNTELHGVLRERFVKLPSQLAHKEMVSVLKKTRDLMPLIDLVDQLPICLQSAALTISLRKVDRLRLLQAVNAKLSEAKRWT